MDGYAPPSKTPPKKNLLTRNYRGNSTNVRIAIASVPVIDVQPIVRVIPTNIGNVGPISYMNILPYRLYLTRDCQSVDGSLLYCILLTLRQKKENIRSV
ncbi:MAG: hypothetical protein HY428_01705 [Candidatus Levybacteria bacterium]|nr:hypothetical protein [Candidatus Levybacteria bacterium]